MIDFEEELKRFHPSTEIGDVEKAVQSEDLTDMNDLMFGFLAGRGQQDGAV